MKKKTQTSLDSVYTSIDKGDKFTALNLIKTMLLEDSFPGAKLSLLNEIEFEPGVKLEKYKRIKVAVLCNYTSQPMVWALRAAFLLEGYYCDIYESPFQAFRQEIIDEKSRYYDFKPDITFLGPDSPGLSVLANYNYPIEERTSIIDAEVKQWEGFWSKIQEGTGSKVIQQLFTAPQDSYVGVAEKKDDSSDYNIIRKLNDRLLSSSPGFIYWLDTDRLSATVGTQNWFDSRLYHHGKFSFSPKYLLDLTYQLGGAVRQVVHKLKKLIIIDLDNTLWGGVIGDDGLDGIVLGPGTAEGEAFEYFCSYLKKLKELGVILAVCSKNEESIATEVFKRHSHMPLNMEDFAAFYCNWKNKAENIRSIVNQINVDSSSVVFLDDNPAECELVYQQLPEVRVVCMDVDPSAFVRKISKYCFFDKQSSSEADKVRSASYAGRLQAEKLKSSSNDLSSYLNSLEMTCNYFRPSEAELERLEQLESKTNQFNLSTRRLAREQIQNMIQDKSVLIFAFFLKDKFAEHGLVSYIAAKIQGENLKITDWLMSCRVFSRTLENFIFRVLFDEANSRKLKSISASRIPTEKNIVIKDLLGSLGFEHKVNCQEKEMVFDLNNEVHAVSYISKKKVK